MSTRLTAVVAALAVVVLILVYSSVFTVEQTEQALVLQFGKPVRPAGGPGLHFKLPYQDVVIYDRRILDFEPPADEVIASDQKRLVVDAYARFKISDALQFYQSLGTEAGARARLGSIISASLRRVIGGIDLQAVVSTQRAAVMQQVRDEVNTQAKGFGIDVIDVRMRRTDLPEENSQAVFDRMKSERQREAASFRADGARQAQEIRADADRQRIEILADAQKQSQILRGQGDAESIKDYADAYNRDRNFFAYYRSLEAYKVSIGGANTTFVIAPQGEFFKYLENGPTGVGSQSAAPSR
ncbi:MAG TPA: protease modulator HflC [Stellaceae bacterium]|nr:protease modulator HflC [Stellaceae bacterium]